MRNRAKCKLCEEVIESLHRNDFVSCKCGEIAIDGGLDYLRSVARDYSNFLRVDDEGSERPVAYVNKNPTDGQVDKVAEEEPKHVLSRADKMRELERFFDHENFDRLPDYQKYSFVTNAQFQSLGLLLISILRDD